MGKLWETLITNVYSTNALSTHLKALFFNKYFMDPSPLLTQGYHKAIQYRSKQMIY